MRCFDTILSAILEDYDQSIPWDQYIDSCGYTRQDLDVLYHGTSEDKLQSIMQHGLDPQFADEVHVHDEEMNDYPDGFGPPYNFVYLSTSPRIARQFAPGGDYLQNNQNNAIMLVIRLPQHLKEKLVLDRGEFIRAPFVIGPQYIETNRL